jgi:hypothetical protein
VFHLLIRKSGGRALGILGFCAFGLNLIAFFSELTGLSVIKGFQAEKSLSTVNYHSFARVSTKLGNPKFMAVEAVL